MVHQKTFEPKFRRRRSGQTNYAKRLALLQSGKPRLVVRKKANSVIVHLIAFEPKGDKVLSQATSAELKQYGWNMHGGNLSAAYLTGLLCALKARKSGFSSAIADIGSHSAVHGSAPFAAIKGAVDGSLNVQADEKVYPSAERLAGKHVSDFAKQLDEGERNKRFSQYVKHGVDPTKFPEHVESVRQKLLKEFG